MTQIPSTNRARRTLVTTLLIALAIAVFVPSTASARDSAARKFGRGVSNMTLGVLAIPGQIMDTSKESGPFVGATWGFAKGVGYTVAHEVVGIFEFLTCPFETPPGYKPILTPEFPWEYFTKSRSSRR